MPPAFEPLISERFYQRAEMWALVGYDRSQPFACRSCQHLKAIGRIRTGVPLEAAIQDIDAVQAQLRREFPADYSPDPMTARSASRGADRRRAAGACGADGRGRLRAADRLRERREPAARADGPPRTRPRAARGARRQPRPPGATAARRKRAACRRRRRARRRHQRCRRPALVRAGAGDDVAPDRREPRRARPWLLRRRCRSRPRSSSAWCPPSARRASTCRPRCTATGARPRMRRRRSRGGCSSPPTSRWPSCC